MPLGLGPVFAYERLTSARRWQTYALRAFVVTALLLTMMTIATAYSSDPGETQIQKYARIGTMYFSALIGVELALVMLAAPAATAGAICLDRARGTLAHVMATDLTDREIVLGKLAARLLPVLALVAGTWPVMAICTLLGGIDPIALALAMAIIVAVALLGCALALALSVWARRPHEVILTTYACWVALVLGGPVWFALSRGGPAVVPSRWLRLSNPYYLVFAPYAAPGQVGPWDYALVFATTLAISLALIGLAVWRVRPVARRMAGEVGREPALGSIGRLRRWLPGPSLEGNPVLWREWHRSRPSAWMSLLVILVAGGSGLACVVGACDAWKTGITSVGRPSSAQEGAVLGAMVQVIVGLLMLSAVAPLSLSEERQRGSLDLLNVTPLSTWAIVLAKWWGTFRIVPALAVAPGFLGFAFATARHATTPVKSTAWDPDLGSRVLGASLIVASILAHGAALVSVGLAVATWIQRQSRAIAISVCVYVLTAVAWPILTLIVFRGRVAEVLNSFSPIAVVGELTADLLTGSSLERRIANAGFGDVTVAAFAASLFWLVGRTFDASFGRVREQRRTSPILADGVVALAATAGAAGLYIAAAIWYEAFFPPRLLPRPPTPADGLTVACYLLLVPLNLLALAAVAALSISPAPCQDGAEAAISTPYTLRKLVLTQWWRSASLALLLAGGPALVALALATGADTDPNGQVIQTTRPAPGAPTGGQPASSIRRIARPEMPLPDRLLAAAALVTMFLAHGAAITSVGLACGAWIKRKSLAIGIAFGAYVAAALAVPLLLAFGGAPVFGERAFTPIAAATSPISAAQHLVLLLLSRQPQRDSFVAVTLLCNIAVAVLAIGLLWLTVRRAERRAGEGAISSRASSSRFPRRLKGNGVPGHGAAERHTPASIR
jgi:ABC-type transport system involved in multi-copper enzyme maturation permease subunit